ncbi:SHOCT domain-containing protein [Actinoplanes sp. NPDC051851]|uniref:SHOCT domain-containing protein n=1 Tax=Actinoplanes sp. NPDC051851 TaxID=3154753 RepID=UPI00343DF16C
MTYEYSAGAGTNALVSLMVILFVAGGVIAGGMIATRARGGPPDTSADAERVLAERFARGEIEAEEYRERLQVLRTTLR